jgi:hypothetical protein
MLNQPFDINDFFRYTKNKNVQRPAIRCKSGLTLSIQANKGVQCCPKEDNGPYTEFEVGFPSKTIADLMPYIFDHYGKGDPKPTASTYWFVPAEVINKVINDNGGMDYAIS